MGELLILRPAKPKVSFVVPCYKLAHLLPECIHSILAQSYDNFEILIMDDCSPDNTPEVARSFRDPRVVHVRNNPNLGHLRNYNKGIEMARGDYIWLISADDRLRRNDALERYVSAMDRHPNAGFAFCPGMALQDGRETRLLDYSCIAGHDQVFKGHDLFRKLLTGNCILAAAGMVRRSCYDKIGMFPLDLPFSGDWYLWLMFSLHFDAVYLAAPMVNYRYHDMAMSNTLVQQDVTICSSNDLVLLWRIHDYVAQLGDRQLLLDCVDALGSHYGDHLACKEYRAGARAGLTLAEFEDSLAQRPNDGLRRRIRAKAYTMAADRFYWKEQYPEALEFYRRALQQAFWAPAIWAKYLLLRSGPLGNYLRETNIRLKHLIGHAR